MKRKMNETTTSFIVKFEGATYFGADNLAKTLNLVTNTIYDITNAADSEAYFKVQVRALRAGSFAIDLSLLLGASLNLLSDPGTLNALKVIKTLFETFKLKRHLKDQIPSQINNNNNGTFDVVNQNGSTMNISIDTMNVFPIIDKELSEIAEIAENENREGIRLQSEVEEEYFSKDDLSSMTKAIDFDEGIKKVSNTFEVNLLLRKPDLMGNSQWDFYFSEHTIHAKIEDEKFLNAVKDGRITGFCAGVQIPVRLRMETDINENGTPIEKSERYFVERVTGDIILPNNRVDGQMSMFNKNE